MLISWQIMVGNALTVLASDAGHSENANQGFFSEYFASIWTAIIFLGTVLILKKFAWGPILKVLDERDNKIKESLEAAERAKAETEKVFEDHKKLILQAREEANYIVNEARDNAGIAKKQIMEEAKKEADAVIARASKEVELQTAKAVAELREYAVNLSLLAAGKVLRRTLSSAEHEKIARECLGDLDHLKN